MRANLFTEEQIAPCGMNCGACSAYLAFSHRVARKQGKISHCSGCRSRNKACAYLKGDCQKIADGQITFCYECADFPCTRLRHIDSRYRASYGTSLIRNLEEIRDIGMDQFLRNQTKNLRCQDCGDDVRSVHNKKCFSCDKVVSLKV